MEFYTLSKEPRPIRLSEETRKFAYESIYEHRYGLDTESCNDVPIEDIENFETLPPLKQYDISILNIVLKAPLRICEGEKISGAATLGVAILHTVPATYKGKSFFSSISHLTTDFETILKIGYEGLREKIKNYKEKCTDDFKLPFYESLLHCVNCFEIWHERYLEKLSELPRYKKNYQNLLNVPRHGAKNFYEAVQSLWFTFSFIRLCGNWPGIGRIDVLLGDYLKKDLAAGILTLDQAREILAHFFIKGCEWITGKGDIGGGGDANHYQNIILSGTDEKGKDVTNEVTYLILDIIEELGISEFPISVRINGNTDEKLLRRISEVMRHGGGIIAIYNEEVVIKSLTDYKYSFFEAVNFANDGCWEVQIPGKTHFSYIPFDALAVLQKKTLQGYENTNIMFDSFEELYKNFIQDINRQVQEIFNIYTKDFSDKNAPVQEWKWKSNIPCTIVSLFENDCIKRGLSYIEGGAVYNVISPHLGGLADAVNSLYAIKKIVFDNKIISFTDFLNVLKNNWEGNEDLRQYVLSGITYYGNDNDEVDEIAAKLLDDFAATCFSFNGKSPIMFPPGISTFGRQTEWAETRLASPHGRKKGEILSGNSSPTPGTDKKGATAIINSYCKADLTKQVSGSALDISLLPSTVNGENGLEALSSLIKGFVASKGFFLQIDIVDTKILKLAKKHPEQYPTLSVRVSGWNARFVTLSKEWQDMIIERDLKE